MKKDKKMFIVRKYIMATSLMEARRLDKKTEPLEIWIDDDWKEGKKNQLASSIGFDNGVNNDDEKD